MIPLRTALFFAQRFVFHTQEKTIRAMTIIAFTSILISTCALALVAAVMNGFDHQTRKAIQGIQPDIIVTAQGRSLKADLLSASLEKHPFVAATSPHSQGHALIKNTFDDEELPSVVVLIGIDPVKEAKVSQLQRMIVKPEGFTLKNTLSSDNEYDTVLMGKTLAENLNVKVGDTVTLLYTDDLESAKDTLAKKEVKIGGIYRTGIDDVDAHVTFMSNHLFSILYPDKGISQIGIKLTSPQDEQKALATLKKSFQSMQVLSWKELYPALLSALVLEKYAMFFILALITLVASMTIVALLFMYITHKKMEVAVLKAMGMQSNDLVKIFLLIGTGISLLASIIGLIIATCISYILEKYPIIRLPDVYYVSHLPAHMDASIILAVLVLVGVISLLSSYAATRQIFGLSPSSALKQVV